MEEKTLKIEELKMDDLDEYLIKLATARLGLRRKIVILKRSLQLFGAIESKQNNMAKEHRIQIDYDDMMTAHNLVSELDDLLKDYGIRLEIEDKEHDGFDVCIVKIEDLTDTK